MVIAAYLFMGLFSQFQTVFACELMDGKVMTVCCCHEPAGTGCEMGGGCSDQQGTLNSDCCQISYQKVPGTTALVSESHAQQVMLLVAPQPPPALLLLLTALGPPDPRLVLFGPAALPPGPPGNLTYLLTRRIRV